MPKEYIKKVNKILKEELLKIVAVEVKLTTAKQIFNSLIIYCDDLLISSKKITPNEIAKIVSHLSAIKHYLQFTSGKAKLNEKLDAYLFLLICSGKKFLKEIKISLRVSKKEVKDELSHNNSNKSLDLYAEQHRLQSLTTPTSESSVKCFLRDIWSYAITHTEAPAKKLFISYGWPEGDILGEKWTTIFIEQFSRDLIEAGVEVYLDQHDSGPGNGLREFMQKIQNTVDHILVISDKTWKSKFDRTVSGVRYECEQIKKRLDASGLNEKEFITILQLSSQNYCREYYKNADVIVFHDLDYLRALKEIICKLYEFNEKEFDDLWKAKLVEHKILRNFWNILPENKHFIGRIECLKKINKAFSRCVLFGPEGIGKTQIALQFIYQHGHQYEGVYWFDANSSSTLIAAYKALAIDKGLSGPEDVKKWLDIHPYLLLIYDGATTAKEIAEYLPARARNILITTRCLDKTFNADLVVEIEKFSLEEAINYSQQFLNKSKDQLEFIRKLCEKVEKTPLILARICGYIQRLHISISLFLTNFEVHSNQAVNDKLMPLRMLNLGEHTVINRQEQKDEERPDGKAKTNSPQLIAYINLVRETLIKLLMNSKLLSNLEPVIRTLIKNLQLSKFNKFTSDFSLLKFLISHLESIHDQLSGSFVGQFYELIEHGKYLVNDLKDDISILPDSEKSETENDGSKPCIVAPSKDYPEDEQRRAEQQKAFCENRLFLLAIWRYALNRSKNLGGYASKTVFISFASPSNNKEDELWTKPFVENIRQHLIGMGIRVYIGDFKYFVDKKIKIDRALIISSRTREKDVNVLTEQNEIIKYARDHKNFMIPILLNNINHCVDDKIKGIAELSFFKDDYLNALRDLISTIYGFDKARFSSYWHKYLVKYRFIQLDSWQLPVKCLDFIGRKTHLAKIKRHTANSASQQLILKACIGFGGNGKTTLVNQFVQLYCHLFGSVYWFNAENENQLVMQYVLFGRAKKILEENDKMSLDQQAKIVKRWLENKAPQNWLIVYDNAPNYKTLSEWIPAKGGKVIITSRHNQWQVKPEDCIDVDVFDLSEAQEYVDKTLDRQDVVSRDKLIHILGRLPLALAHACAYIKYNGISISEYLARYNDYKKNEKLTPIGITWNISLQAIEKESEAAAALLKIYAYLGSKNIPKEVAAHSFRIAQQSQFTEKDLINAIRVGSEYSMISVSDNGELISMHNLLQATIRASLKADKTEANIFKTVLLSMLAYLNNLLHKEDYKALQQLIFHAIHAWEENNNILNNKDSENNALHAGFLTAIFETSSYFYKFDHYKKYFIDIIRIVEDNPITELLKVFSGIIFIAFDGQENKSKNMQLMFSNITKINLNSLSKKIITADNNLWFESLYCLVVRITDENHRWAIVFGAALCCMYAVQGNYEKYRIYLHYIKKLRETFSIGMGFSVFLDVLSSATKEALPIIQGMASIALPAALNQIFGDIILLLQQEDDSELINQVIPIVKQIWAHDHIHVGRLYLKQGNYWMSRGNVDLAVNFLTDALPILKKYLTEIHPDVIKVYINLSICHSNSENSEKKHSAGDARSAPAIKYIDEAVERLFAAEKIDHDKTSIDSLRQEINNQRRRLGLPPIEPINPQMVAASVLRRETIIDTLFRFFPADISRLCADYDNVEKFIPSRTQQMP